MDSRLIIGEWLDRCERRPPGSVIGQLGKLVKGMLDEGIAADDIRGGLVEWQSKALHPSTLPSVVNGVMNAHSAPFVSETDRNIARMMAGSPELRVIAGGDGP